VADVHSDVDHHRTVFTLIARPDRLVADVLALARETVERVDLRHHAGVHPRLGALDVVPFVALGAASVDEAVAAREATIAFLATLGVPSFRYGPLSDGTVRSLPEVRRRAFVDLRPDAGPSGPHPTAGASAVGVRDPLVAWNLWLKGVSLDETRAIAASLRSASVRALGFPVTGGTQVSCNLLAPDRVTPGDVFDRVAGALPAGGAIDRSELVGLAPSSVLAAVPEERWELLDLRRDRTIEAAIVRLGLAPRE
jgi:glutamate formiminotransferase